MNEKFITKFTFRRTRSNTLNRVFTNGYGCINRYLYNLYDHIKAFKRNTYQCCQKHNISLKGLLKSECGALVSFEILLWLTVIVFIIFGGIDYYIAEKQLNDIDEIKSHYLSKMKISGTFSREFKDDIEDELEDKGLEIIDVYAKDGYNNYMDDDDVIFRNVDDVKSSVIKLYIKAKPRVEPFAFGKLLGAKENDEFYFYRKGRTISERPNY